jgi:quercetin dioxygenase-like cupin family protein
VTVVAHFVANGSGEVAPEPLGRPRHVKITADATRGAYTLTETTLSPGRGAPPHVHAEHEEVFYVLDGHIAFVAGEDVLDARVGDVVLIPRGVEHAFDVVGDGDARYLCIFSPPITEQERASLARQAAATRSNGT